MAGLDGQILMSFEGCCSVQRAMCWGSPRIDVGHVTYTWKHLFGTTQLEQAVPTHRPFVEFWLFAEGTVSHFECVISSCLRSQEGIWLHCIPIANHLVVRVRYYDHWLCPVRAADSCCFGGVLRIHALQKLNGFFFPCLHIG